MLELAHLHRRYGEVVALDGLSMTVQPGRVTGFLGPNGAGKTTAMRAVFGLVALHQGEVRFEGHPVTRESRRRFGYLPEERGLYPKMPLRDQLVFFARLRGVGSRRAVAVADEWLERFGLAERARTKVEALSLGNQQRAQLAVALVHEPDLLVLDEPFSGLDPTGIDAMATLLAEQATAGRTVLFSSHQLDLVENVCEAVCIIDSGRIVAAGPVRELTLAGDPRLAVAVDGDFEGRWAEGLAGVEISERVAGQVRLILDDGVRTDGVLDAARRAGAIRHFSIERRRLSEVFRDAVGSGVVRS